MIDAQLNYFDMAVIGIMLLSCVFAFFRGFVKEILSLIGWVGAAAVTVYFFKPASEMLQPYFAKPLIASICASIGLYLGSLIAFAIINRIIIKILKSGSEIGWLDNLLGLAFGALRGAFIISLGYFMMSVAVQGNYPEWLEKAKTRPYVEQTSAMLVKMVPKNYLEELSQVQNKARDSVENRGTKDLERSIYNQADDAANKIDGGLEHNTKDAEKTFNQILKDLGK